MQTVEPIRDRKQIDNIKRYLKEKNPRNYLLFILGINSGLRISDLLSLKIDDVYKKDKICIREKKTGKEKQFPINDNCRKAVESFLRQEKNKSGYLFKSRKKDGTKGTGRISRQQAYGIINNAAKAVGIKEKIGTHTLRKTWGYYAYKAGYDLSLIQQILNHSSARTTLRYIGITQDNIDDVYINLNL